MIDGIDGLLGGLSCVSFAAIGFLMYRDGQMDMAHWSFALIASILPYLMLNLGIHLDRNIRCLWEMRGVH